MWNSAPGQSEEGIPSTNLEQIRAVARSIAMRVAAEQLGTHDSTSAFVQVLPKETSWYIERAVRDGLKAKNITASADTTNTLHFIFGISRVSVAYENIHREGLFGSKVVERMIELELESRIMQKAPGGMPVARLFSLADSIRDVIDVSDVSRVENPAIGVTKGRLPSEGFFDNIAEPLVLIGSIAVAVLLLFSVRS